MITTVHFIDYSGDQLLVQQNPMHIPAEGDLVGIALPDKTVSGYVVERSFVYTASGNLTVCIHIK